MKNNAKTNNAWVGAGLLAAITASLCCITPVLAFVSGLSGIAATFSWMEPVRPYLIGLTFSVLGFAWYQKLKPQEQNSIDCDCEEDGKEPFIQSKRFLSIVTIFSMIMLAFPYYSDVFYPDIKPKSNYTSTSELVEVVFEVNGMTCESCDAHVRQAAADIDGVSHVEASYKTGLAKVKFDQTITSKDEIEDAINKTGYKVTRSQVVEDEEHTAILTGLASNSVSTIEWNIKGMTCTGCEAHVKHAVLELDGIISVNASYEEANTTIEYIPGLVRIDQIKEAINKTGYKVIDDKVKQRQQ